MNQAKKILDFIQPKKVETPTNDYFDQLAKSVIHKHSKKSIPLYKKPIYRWISAAAVLVPFIFYFVIFQKEDVKVAVYARLKAIPQEDIHTYILENIEEFETDEIIEMTDSKSIDEFRTELITLKTNCSPTFFETVSVNEIEAYFESENIEIDEFNENNLFI